MTWATVIMALLTLTQHLLGWLRDKQLIDAGADAEIARQTLAILEITEKGKAVKARIDAMSDDELDDFLKELGR